MEKIFQRVLAVIKDHTDLALIAVYLISAMLAFYYSNYFKQQIYYQNEVAFSKKVAILHLAVIAAFIIIKKFA